MQQDWDWTIEVRDFEPVAKGRPRFTAQGRPYTPPKTRIAEGSLATLLLEQAPEDPFTGPLAVRIICYMKRPKKPKYNDYPAVKPDLDNLIKLIKDAGNEILWEDDALICESHCYKVYENRDEQDAPGVTISIRALSPPEDSLVLEK